MTMWVWRFPKDDECFYSNAAQVKRAAQFFIESFRRTGHPNLQPYARCNFDPVPVDRCRTFMIDQVFQANILRQGWCGVGLDLRQGRNAWIDNWRLLIDPIDDGTYADAPNLYGRVSRILEIEVGDIIFLPRVNDYNHFTVVVVKEPYRFEDRRGFTHFWELDYGHTIIVDGRQTGAFPYGPQTLQAGVFGAPFMQCVVRVPHSYFRGFDRFLRDQNYLFNAY